MREIRIKWARDYLWSIVLVNGESSNTLKIKWQWKFASDFSRERNWNIFNNIEVPSVKIYYSNDIMTFTSYISSDIVVRSIFIVNLNSFFRHSDSDWFLPSRTYTYPGQYFTYRRIEFGTIGFTTLTHTVHQPLALDLGGIQYTEKWNSKIACHLPRQTNIKQVMHNHFCSVTP